MITKDMYVADIIMMDRGVVPVFMEHGLHCIGCAISSAETVEMACMVHGIDCDTLLADLNQYFGATETEGQKA